MREGVERFIYLSRHLNAWYHLTHSNHSISHLILSQFIPAYLRSIMRNKHIKCSSISQGTILAMLRNGMSTCNADRAVPPRIKVLVQRRRTALWLAPYLPCPGPICIPSTPKNIRAAYDNEKQMTTAFLLMMLSISLPFSISRLTHAVTLLH